MMNRRELVKAALVGGTTLFTFGLAGCGKNLAEGFSDEALAAARGEVILYDTYFMAMYMDGGLGPKTGILKVDYVKANQPVTLEFWHGHGGVNHKFTITPEHFAEIKKLKKVYIQTNVVDGHSHKLFVDVSDKKWRVAGALPVPVEV